MNFYVQLFASVIMTVQQMIRGWAWRPRPEHFLPRVLTPRTTLSRKGHRALLASPNFRYDLRLPQPPKPNLALGPQPIWPIKEEAMNAFVTPRIDQLSTPKIGALPAESLIEAGSVSRSALKARPSPRIQELSQPKVTYMVGLTMEMQDQLGDSFRERMRSHILDTLGTSYAELALGPKASDMRDFYQQQDVKTPLEPYSCAPEPQPGGGVSRVHSREERLQWEAARARPKRDFTVFQRVPERKSMPYSRLLPRIEVLSAPSPRFKTQTEMPQRDPFKVSEGAMNAKVTERLEQLARPRSRPEVR